MHSRTIILTGGLSLMVAVLLGLVAFWYFVLDTDAQPPVSLEDAAGSLATPPGSSSAATAPVDASELTGEWTLAGDGTSFAGYRIDQQVAGIGSETVVGRTQAVEATFSFDGPTISDLQVTVDMTALQSGESLRDSVLRGEGLETGDFPTATFTLIEPISLTALPAESERVTQIVAGDLTLHGVTRPIETTVEAVLQNGRLIVVASNEVQLADFDITPPAGPASVLSVEDHGIMEVQLVFEPFGTAAQPDVSPTEAAPAIDDPADPY